MKKFLFTILCFGSFGSFAQNAPFGYSMNQEQLDHLGVMELPTFDQQQLIADAEYGDKMGTMAMYGKVISQPTDANSVGAWTELPNGDRIWQLRFRSAGAKAVSVFFNNMYLPEGSSLCIYSADREWFEGPYDFSENEEHGHFRTGETFGDEAILEYYEPLGVIGAPRLGISGFGYFYRFIDDLRPSQQMRNDSEACEVDVNCPEGDDWSNEKRAVIRLSLVSAGGVGLCSGTLVNNTSYDCKNYILTAMHCVINSSDADLLLTQIRFNYQKTGCGTGSAPTTQQKVGALLRADSNDGGGSTGSDFALLEMDDAIPAGWSPFYAGWNADTGTPSSGTSSSGTSFKVMGIHHPAGDVKKISTSDNVASATWGAPNQHWKVTWKATETNWGVTEGGSSGSPIFDKDHLIVGTLTGGGSFCTSPSASDYYGKFDKHWNGNPNAEGQDLKDWLDSANTGLTSVPGSYVGTSLSQPCFSVGIEETLAFTDVNMYPNIANANVTIQTDRFREIKEMRIFDGAGALVQVVRLYSSATTIDVSSLAAGLYYTTFILENGNHLTKKLSVVH